MYEFIVRFVQVPEGEYVLEVWKDATQELPIHRQVLVVTSDGPTRFVIE